MATDRIDRRVFLQMSGAAAGGLLGQRGVTMAPVKLLRTNFHN